MTRTLLIALDGGTFDVLDPLVAEGVMPTLGRLIRAGSRGVLMSTPNPLTPPAFTSMVTGRTPGNHGIFDFIRVEHRGDLPYFRLVNARDVRCETIWSIVSRGGRSVASLNFIATYPPPRVNGYVVPGFVTSRHLKTAVHPPALYAELKALDGFEAKAMSWDLEQGRKPLLQGLSPDECDAVVEYQIRREQQWFRIARHLLAQRPCDLTAVVFDGLDKLQHMLWPFIDPTGAGAGDASADGMRRRCRRYFAALDGYLAELVALAGPDARVFVASDHGFGPSEEIFYANRWLAERGYLAWREGAPVDDSESLTSSSLKRHYESIDWRRTVAYARTSSSNGIYIRLAERPGDHGVTRADYTALRARLAAELLAYRDPVHHRHVVSRVLLREEAFPGARMDEAPDLTLVLRDGGFLSIVNAPVAYRPRSQVTGTHRREGILLAVGPGVRRGARLSASIVDVMPTLLYSLGLPVPEDCEGRPLTELFTSEQLRAHPPRQGPATEAVDPPGAVESAPVDEAEESQVVTRLKALGYL